MTDRELTGKVHSAMYHQCQRRGYAAPVDVLMEIGVLPKEKYEDWRRGPLIIWSVSAPSTSASSLSSCARYGHTRRKAASSPP